jgi:hypothetical protein
LNNKYTISEDGSRCEIFFHDGSSFLIDSEDLDKISHMTWFRGKRGYPVAATSRKLPGGRRNVSVHRLLLSPPQGYDVDHISGDKLDNRKSNLRICSHQQNMFNQKMRSTNSSGYYGVSYMKNCGKYEAYIHFNGRKNYLGIFDTVSGAAAARDAAAKRLFGDYARLNAELCV